MASKAVLGSLIKDFEDRSGCKVMLESVGGVDAAQRIQDGEPFDFAVLASNAIDRLTQSGHLLSGSRIDLFRSPVAVAVRAGAPHPDLGSEESVRAAVLAARSVGYSTGPSGNHLRSLFERWGIAEVIKARIVQPPPGVPVGSLVAQGEVELGFQQLSELKDLQDIDLLGVLPRDCEFITTFSAGVCAGTARAGLVGLMLQFMISPETTQTKRLYGMEPAE